MFLHSNAALNIMKRGLELSGRSHALGRPQCWWRFQRVWESAEDKAWTQAVKSLALYESKYWYALLNQLADAGIGLCVRAKGQLANHIMILNSVTAHAGLQILSLSNRSNLRWEAYETFVATDQKLPHEWESFGSCCIKDVSHWALL